MHSELQTLLEQRIAVIADHAFRDCDAAAHLEALKQVSERIESFIAAHRSEFDPKLRHYLQNASYQKALDHLKDQ